ncbi:MAG: glutathione S-transferase family protein [Myxococcales bacterium]|nr:glutathione S-transferase family protein [Myxococcales bacterium]
MVNGSISSWRVLVCVYEKGLPCRAHRLRVMRERKETRSPEFLAINPRGKAPVLVEPDGVVVSESFAILEFIERRYPEPALLSREPAAMARELARTHEAETFACAYEGLESLFVTDPSAMSEGDRREIERCLAAVEWELDLWESRANESTFIAGEALTMADVSFYPTLAYMLRRGLSLAARPKLDAYQRRMRERPSCARAFPEGWTHEVGKRDLFALARSIVGTR